MEPQVKLKFDTLIDELFDASIKGIGQEFRLAPLSFPEDIEIESPPGDNPTGFTGVYAYHYKGGKTRYRAHIDRKGKHFHVGCYDTKEEAAAARCEALSDYNQPSDK